MSVFWKYFGAFLSGYAAAILPVLAGGNLPDARQAIAAIAPGLLATGLLHLPSPANNEGGN